jgi:hypothetical protein
MEAELRELLSKQPIAEMSRGPAWRFLDPGTAW